MEDIAQASESQAALPQKPVKPTSIKILQSSHLILGIFFILSGLYLLITNIGELKSTSGVMFLLVIFLIPVWYHFSIFYHLLRFKGRYLKIAFLYNLIVFLLLFGLLMFALFVLQIPSASNCTSEVIYTNGQPQFKLCPMYVPFVNPRPLLLTTLTPLTVFNFISLLVIWINYRSKKNI